MGDGVEGFELTRRGYDRVQVDEYFARLAGGTDPGDPPRFDIVRRGYDRDQVDSRIAQLRAG
ncbi:hypothetical protein ACWEQU_24195 [Streptomyces nodosus]